MEIVSDWELIWSKNSLSIDDENVNAATDISHEQTRRYNITFKQLVTCLFQLMKSNKNEPPSF